MPVVNVRSFNGTSDYIKCSIGAIPLSVSAAFSAISIHWYNTGGTTPFLGVKGTGAGYWTYYQNSSRWRLYDAAGTGPKNGTTNIQTQIWYVVIVTKPTGTSTPRFHIFNCSTGVWVHENGDATVGAGAAASSTPLVELGIASSTPSYFNGRIWLNGIWTRELSDSDCVSLTSLKAIIASSPSGLWILDQPSVGTAVSDYTPNGANQSSISGTTVVSDTISNFDTTYPGPVFDVASSSGYEASLSTYSWSHTCTGTNRGLLVAVSIFASGTVSSITYAGANMIFVRADSNGIYRTEIWRLESPAPGSNTIQVNLSASLTSIASACSYTNVNQSNMIEANHGANGLGGTPTDSITTIAADATVLSAISTADTTTSPTEMQRSNNTGALGSGAVSDYIDVVVPSSRSMTWADVGVADSWALSLVSIVPAIPSIAPNPKPKFVYLRKNK